MSLAALFNRTVTLERPVVTRDGSGASKRVWVVVQEAQDIPCAIQPVSATSRIALGQRMNYVTHKVYLDQDIGLKRKDRLRDQDGRLYLVVGYENSAGRDELWIVHVREQQP
jgi:head-tail adaptor